MKFAKYYVVIERSLYSSSLEGNAKLLQPICDLIWIGCRNAFFDDRSVLIDGTDRGGRKRNV
jgi:hypothetical protein